MKKIVIKGAREHNLKNIDVEIPRDKLVVITGLSGSGKSSLAFDTIYAEGQRRYVESLSAYARQFLEQMRKPDVDSIEGLSPAISIEQKTGLAQPALDRRHRHRDLRLPAPAVGARRQRPLLELRAADRLADHPADGRPGPGAARRRRASRCWRRSCASARATSPTSWRSCARTASCAPTSTASWPSWPSRRKLDQGQGAHHRGVRRPAGAEGRHPPAADRLDRAGGEAGRRRRQDLAARGRRPAVLREVRLPDLRHHATPRSRRGCSRSTTRPAPAPPATASAPRCSSIPT